MKRVLVLFTAVCFAISVKAGDDKKVVSTVLKSATVYRLGAELVHTAKVALTQGNNELILDNISNRIDLNSLQIGSKSNLSILSVEFATNFLNAEQKSPIVKRLEDSLEVLTEEIVRVQVVIKTDQELLDLLKANKEIRGQQNGLSVAELAKMMEYYKAKTLELQSEISRYKEKETKLNAISYKIGRQIKEEEQKNSKSIGRVALQLYCPLAGQYEFTVSYLTTAASWSPAYDLRVDNISKPVQLAYKAKLAQHTGIDWKQVKLALSTSIPAQYNNAPEMNTWFLAYNNPVYTTKDRKQEEVMEDVAVESPLVALRGRVPGLEVTEAKAKKRQNNEPLYVVNGNVMSKDEVDKINPNDIKELNVLKDGQATAIYGSRSVNGVVMITLKEIGDYISVKDNQLNVVFDIELPYDVPSNGKEQNVSLKDFTLPAVYKYYTAPRLDKDAYLVGSIVNWEALNLLPGEATINFEGTYIGKTAINAGTVKDSLNLTLGKDKRVVVTREKLADFSSTKMIGLNKKQTFTYEITVRNNKKEAIELEVQDQYPVSTNKDIEVEAVQHEGASANTETGIVTWKAKLAPGEIKKYRISYSVKYPKDKLINL